MLYDCSKFVSFFVDPYLSSIIHTPKYLCSINLAEGLKLFGVLDLIKDHENEMRQSSLTVPAALLQMIR